MDTVLLWATRDLHRAPQNYGVDGPGRHQPPKRSRRKITARCLAAVIAVSY
jgi:hypothetical protein